MKRFFGGLFIEKERLEEAGIFHPIKLEYYKNIDRNKFGISIVRTEYKENNLEIERKDIEYITEDENVVNRILNIFKQNEVTPINSEEIIEDLKCGNFMKA